MRSIHLFLLIVSGSLIFFTNCAKNSESAAAPSTGKGGSLARFTISGNHLYLADAYSLETYDISNAVNPVHKNSAYFGRDIETIFPFKDKLFIGSAEGMYIFSLANPDQPKLLGQALHFRSCDPVVANDTMAYVTLRGGTRCGPATDGLYTYNIKDVSKPVQKSLLELSNPYGLGQVDSVVFVCRGNKGLTAVNVKNPSSPKVMYTLTNGDYKDVIPYDNVMICYVTTGIKLYDLTNLGNIRELGSYTY
jgi:hypothetical protein